MDYCRARFRVDWMFLERFVPFFLKVVFVMDSGCSLRGTLRALRDRSAATTLAQTLLSPTLLDAFSKNFSFFHMLTIFPRSCVASCSYMGSHRIFVGY